MEEEEIHESLGRRVRALMSDVSAASGSSFWFRYNYRPENLTY